MVARAIAVCEAGDSQLMLGWSERQRGGLVVGALILGFVAGVIARLLIPNDAFNRMSGPTSWAVSVLVGLGGALLGWFIFTKLLGIGDDDIFDLGGIVGAIIGTLILLPLVTAVLRRTNTSPS